MGGYAYKGAAPSAPVIPVEQARRHNAAMHAELRDLAAERATIAAHVKTMRAELTAARNKLSRQIRHLDTVRIQEAQIEAAANFVSTLPDPIHGGRDGLQAATDELLAHTPQGLKLHKDIPRKGISHGTARKYESGCRCPECQDWRKRKAARAQTNRKRRQQENAA